MCEANAYLIEGEEEMLVMESVDTIEPVEDGVKLSLPGLQAFVWAFAEQLKWFWMRPANIKSLSALSVP
jgi:hypothetical protein